MINNKSFKNLFLKLKFKKLQKLRVISCSYIIIMFLLSGLLANSQQLHKVVNTQIGSQGNCLKCGYNFVGATYPFGMVQFTPSFFSPQKGFVVNQLSGAGCPHMGNFPVLPFAGPLINSPNKMESFEKYE